jgi:hypothetical protein
VLHTQTGSWVGKCGQNVGTEPHRHPPVVADLDAIYARIGVPRSTLDASAGPDPDRSHHGTRAIVDLTFVGLVVEGHDFDDLQPTTGPFPVIAPPAASVQFAGPLAGSSLFTFNPDSYDPTHPYRVAVKGGPNNEPRTITEEHADDGNDSVDRCKRQDLFVTRICSSNGFCGRRGKTITSLA